jgi:hypothetical protein
MKEDTEKRIRAQDNCSFRSAAELRELKTPRECIAKAAASQHK